MDARDKALADAMIAAGNEVATLVPARPTATQPAGTPWPLPKDGKLKRRAITSDAMARSSVFGFVVVVTAMMRNDVSAAGSPAAKALANELFSAMERRWSYRFADTLDQVEPRDRQAVTAGAVGMCMSAAALQMKVAAAMASRAPHPFEALHRFLEQYDTVSADKLDRKFSSVTRRWLSKAAEI